MRLIAFLANFFFRSKKDHSIKRHLTLHNIRNPSRLRRKMLLTRSHAKKRSDKEAAIRVIGLIDAYNQKRMDKHKLKASLKALKKSLH